MGCADDSLLKGPSPRPFSLLGQDTQSPPFLPSPVLSCLRENEPLVSSAGQSCVGWPTGMSVSMTSCALGSACPGQSWPDPTPTPAPAPGQLMPGQNHTASHSAQRSEFSWKHRMTIFKNLLLLLFQKQPIKQSYGQRKCILVGDRPCTGRLMKRDFFPPALCLSVSRKLTAA